MTALGDHHKSEAWARIRSGGSAVLTHAHGRRRISVDLSSPRGRRAGWRLLRLSLSSAWAAPHLYVGGYPPHVGRAPSIRGQSPLYTWAEPPLYVGGAPLYTWAEPPLYVGGAPSIRGRSPSIRGRSPSIRGRSPLCTWAGPRLRMGFALFAGRAPSLRGRSPSSARAEPAPSRRRPCSLSTRASPALCPPRRPHSSLLLDPGSAPSKVGVRARCCRSPRGRVALRMRCAR